jgi:peptidoglycan/LPS O-acetylase OafA/YrhL
VSEQTPIVANVDHTYRWMDFARAAAAMLVLVGHARDLLIVDFSGSAVWASFYALTGLGHTAVIVFFVLSGFWITRTAERRLMEPSTPFWTPYLIDRLSRLWVVLLPALALGYVLDRIGLNGWPVPYSGGGEFHSGGDVHQALSGGVILGNIAFLQGLVVPPLGSNGPLWSLAYEFWFYLWFPALFILVRRRRFSPWLVTLAMGLLYPKLILGFACWLVGAALAIFLPRYRNRRLPTGVRMTAFLVAAAALLANSAGLPLPQPLLDFIAALGFGGALTALLASPIRFPKWLAPAADYGANASYSLYVIHFPIIYLVAAAFFPVRLTANPTSLAALFGLCLAMVLLAYGFAALTERRTPVVRQWAKRLLAPRARGAGAS